MTRSEARANAAERRRSRIKEAGGRILQVALRADGVRHVLDELFEHGEREDGLAHRI